MRSLRDRRRRRLRSRPFPADAAAELSRHVALYRRLPAGDRSELHGHIHVLLAEKRFEGAGGFSVTAWAARIIAAQAGILLLHRKTEYFPTLASVIVYPSEYRVEEAVEDEGGWVDERDETRVGESWRTGALILAWEDVAADAVEDEALQNVVLHEFAHQLDAEDGALNGAPALPPPLRGRWAGVCERAYRELGRAVERGAEPVLDPYGLEDPAEFFAVATEAFFLDPDGLRGEDAALYALLADYYRQDPASWTAG